MLFLLLSLYVLLITVLQTVVFSRLQIFGVSPDLFLVSVIICAALDKGGRSFGFALVLGLIKDLLSFGSYFNVVTKLLVAAMINLSKEKFVWNKFLLCLSFVLVISPALFAIEGIMIMSNRVNEIIWAQFIFKTFIATIYNLLAVFMLYPLVKKICHD